MAAPKDRNQLLAWANVLEDYARDWDKTFTSADFFTQEYWYLFTNCLMKHWQQEEFTVAMAQERMKALSPGAKRQRIGRAQDAGLIQLVQSPVDARQRLVKPTAKLEKMMTNHLRRTLAMARTFLD
jgi:hypothetical protein